MCIIFMYNGFTDSTSDYSLIVATNRDECYDRAAQQMGPWDKGQNIYGGIDLGSNCRGTWLAFSKLHKKFGAMLNIPGKAKENAQNVKNNYIFKGRGKVLADYIISDISTNKYIEDLNDIAQKCNKFILVTVNFDGNLRPVIQTYSNVSHKLESWKEKFVGFSNSVPGTNLTKVKVGKVMFEEVCRNYSRQEQKQQLIEQLINVLKCKEKHLPDPLLQAHKPDSYEYLSSIYVSIPAARYGTRTHTVILVTKTGIVDIIESTMRSPVDAAQPQWIESKYRFNLSI